MGEQKTSYRWCEWNKLPTPPRRNTKKPWEPPAPVIPTIWRGVRIGDACKDSTPLPNGDVCCDIKSKKVVKGTQKTSFRWCTWNEIPKPPPEVIEEEIRANTCSSLRSSHNAQYFSVC